MSSVDLSAFFGGGNSSSAGGSGILNQWVQTYSSTFTVPYTTNYLVTAIGAGGGGGMTGGGGGGGLAQSLLPFTKGDTLTLVIAARTASDADGGNTTVTGPSGLLLTATGGLGALSGRLGGTGTGGNIMNVQGGTGSNWGASCGGGAVGVYGYVCHAPTSGTYAGYGAGTGGSSMPFSTPIQIADTIISGTYLGAASQSSSLTGGSFQGITFIGGRLLCPAGFNTRGLNYAAWPGAGGTPNGTTNGGFGGLFAGGGSDCSGGSLGGGSGSGNSGKYGGCGGVIIEWSY